MPLISWGTCTAMLVLQLARCTKNEQPRLAGAGSRIHRVPEMPRGGYMSWWGCSWIPA